MEPITELALPLIKAAEGCWRRRNDSKLIAYADPASPLGKAIRRLGKWNLYLACRWQPSAELADLSGGPWTIGFGATGEGINANTVWPQAQADARLADDVSQRVQTVLAKATRKLSQHEAAALASFLFNVGHGRFGDKDGLFELRTARRPSTLWIKAMAGDTSGVVLELAKWTKAQGEVLPGLVTRRKTEADLYRGKP